MENSQSSILGTRGIRLPHGGAELLSSIVVNKAVSRSELEMLTGLSRSTIVQKLAVLIAGNVVIEAFQTRPSGGRPTKLVKLNDDFALTIAVDIGETLTRVAITNLAPHVLSEATFATDLTRTPDSILSEIASTSTRLLERMKRPRLDVIGIGLSIPAPVDYDHASVFGPSVMRGWDNFDIRSWFDANLHLSAFADNDVNLIALAEHRFFWPDENYFFFVKAGTGIGSGILQKKRIFRGAQGSAGDIGHLQLDHPHAHLCRCGKLGCLEASAAGWAIAKNLREMGFEAENARDVVSLINQNVPEAIQAVREAGRKIGDVLANVVSILNPNLIVIGGTLAQAEAHLLAGVREKINQRCLPLATRKLRIAISRADDRAGIRGAAQLVIDEQLQNLHS